MKKGFILLALCIILLTGCQSQTQTSNNSGSALKEITGSELSSANGKNGNECFVAVSDRVYEIKGSSKWVNGVHTESDGEAGCGRDLTTVIRRAPHGISILTSSPKISQIGVLVD